jgi:hypothetical protein
MVLVCFIMLAWALSPEYEISPIESDSSFANHFDTFHTYPNRLNPIPKRLDDLLINAVHQKTMQIMRKFFIRQDFGEKFWILV